MATNYTIYTSANCNYCNLAKETLTKAGLTYTEIPIQSDPSIRGVVVRLWESLGITTPTVPMIVDNATNTPLGGYNELVELLT